MTQIMVVLSCRNISPSTSYIEGGNFIWLQALNSLNCSLVVWGCKLIFACSVNLPLTYYNVCVNCPLSILLEACDSGRICSSIPDKPGWKVENLPFRKIKVVWTTMPAVSPLLWNSLSPRWKWPLSCCLFTKHSGLCFPTSLQGQGCNLSGSNQIRYLKAEPTWQFVCLGCLLVCHEDLWLVLLDSPNFQITWKLV